jgi:hypothetical protein
MERQLLLDISVVEKVRMHFECDAFSAGLLNQRAGEVRCAARRLSAGPMFFFDMLT